MAEAVLEGKAKASEREEAEAGDVEEKQAEEVSAD